MSIDINSIKYKLAVIESILVYNIRPIFLSVTEEYDEANPFIHIVIAHNQFTGMPMVDRVQYVYDLLNREDPDILKLFHIVVEAFDTEQLQDLFDLL